MHTREIEDESSNVKDMEGNEIHTKSDCIDADEAKPSIEPSVSMGFKSVNDAWEFYKTFGKETGFPVMKSTCNKNVAGDIRSYTFACARAGKSYAVSEKPSIKCGCLAKLVLRLDCLNGYVISKIVLEHNHELKPENARFFRCNRYVSASVKKDTKAADAESCVKLDLKRSHTSMKDNVGSRRNAVEQDRYNSLCILFHELAKRAVKSEVLYNEIKQWLVMKLEELKNLKVEPKGPATNDCKEGEEKDSPEEEIVDTMVDDAVLDPKRNKKSPIASSDGNASNEPDGPEAGDVQPPTSKRQGGPPGSENKNKKTTDSSGARNVQAVPQQESNEVAPLAHMYQPIGVAPPAHMYQANGVAPQVHMYQPWVFYGHPRPHYVGPPMGPYAMSYFHMQGSTLPLPTTPNTQKFGG